MEPLLAYSTVEDGNMSVNWGPEGEVIENRKKFLEKFGLTYEDAVVAGLEHKDHIEVVHAGQKGTYIKTEALLTNEEGLVLMMFTGDCSPISFYDPAHKAIALGHMSWDTTALTLSKKVVSAMTHAFGTVPSDLSVTIGPSVRKDSYIQKEVKQKNSPEWAPYLREVEGGTAIDVVGYNIDQLISAGVKSTNITVDPTDTIVQKTTSPTTALSAPGSQRADSPQF